jgi:hypothetical protein
MANIPLSSRYTRDLRGTRPSQQARELADISPHPLGSDASTNVLPLVRSLEPASYTEVRTQASVVMR